MKLKRKTLFECSISIPVIESDKEGMLVGGFASLGILDTMPPINVDCLNNSCSNNDCVNGGCANDSCANNSCGNVSSGSPTPTATSSGYVWTSLFGF